MKIVTPEMVALSRLVLRYLTTQQTAAYRAGEQSSPTADEAVSAARRLRALLDE